MGFFVAQNAFPRYPWNIHQTFKQQFMKGFFSFGRFVDARGMFQGYVGVLLDSSKIPFKWQMVQTNAVGMVYHVVWRIWNFQNFEPYA